MSNNFFAGFSRADITPEGKMQLVGQFHTRVADHANDPLTANVMAMGTPTEPVIWISLDLLQIPGFVTEQIASAIAEVVPGFER